MNYFALLGLPVQFGIDLNQLRSNYIQLQKIQHPDKVGGNTRDSAHLNTAYTVLLDNNSRALHIFELHNLNTLATRIDPSKLNDAKANPKLYEQKMIDAFDANQIHEAYEYWCLCQYAKP
jgi:curved DNA-binding protein CbpA